MFKTRKALLMMLVFALMLTAIAGCGQSSSKNDKDEQGRTVLSVGNWPVKEGDYLTTITRQKEEFEEENPTMAIKPDTWGFDLQTFYSKAAAGQLPDLYYANFTEIQKIVDGEYYTDLTEGLKHAGYEGKFNDAILDLISADGKIVTFPTDAYSLGLAYNVDLFERSGLMNEDGTPMQPKDWNEVVEFGKKIKEATGKSGFMIPTMNNCGGWLVTPIAWSYGVEFMKPEGEGKYTATFDSQEMADTVQFISDLKWKHNIFGDNALIDLDEYYKQFALGNIGMILAAGNFADSVYKYEMPIENIGIMAFPEGPEKHVTLVGGYTATVANGATNDQVDVAIKWLEKTGKTCKLDEKSKKSSEENYQQRVKDNKVVGIRSLSVYNENSEVEAFRTEMIEKYKNIDLNHVKLYNDSLKDTSIELRPEEPVCAQELYAALDGIIQEVLTNKDADIKALIKKAQEDFQNNQLNNAF